MNNVAAFYPPNPTNVSDELLEPSPAFKQEVKKVMGSILLFFIVYVVLILLSVVISIVCFYIGIAMLSVGHWLAIAAGVGIMSIGVMIFFFLIKFIFSVKKFDDSGSIVITEAEEPRLFEFIRQLTKDTQTQFPKKIVISPDVNACVYYNDSFWSMMFPVKKNLQIGLGLVNSLTLTEFKAVMAHEFGHFSQRSMRLGSFVYNVNKAVYNMLYENKDFGGLIQGWGNLHWAIGIFVWLTVQIIRMIQKILQAMYGLINKNYMGLSRQMEFHADTVAASVSGSINLVSSLRKIEVSDACYNIVIQKANEYFPNHGAFENVYNNHDIVMKQYAEEYDLPLQSNVPVPDEAFFKNFELSRINIKNQWASHPSREDREQHLNNINIQGVQENDSAWVLFADPGGLQKKLSGILYKNAPADMKTKIMPAAAFRTEFLDHVNANKLPAEYNEYYDNRVINEMDIDAVFSKNYEGEISKEEFEKLFAPEKKALSKLLRSNESDAEIVKAIIDKRIELKTFDFDGEKFEKKDAPMILARLNKEIDEQKKQLQEHEEKVVSFFNKAARRISDETASALKEKYITLFEYRKKANLLYESGGRVLNILSPLMHGQQVSIESAREMAGNLRSEGDEIKKQLPFWLAKNVFDKDPALKEIVERFIKAQYFYFSDDRFFDSELKDIHSASVESLALIDNFQFKNFKALLEYQLDIYHKLV